MSHYLLYSMEQKYPDVDRWELIKFLNQAEHELSDKKNFNAEYNRLSKHYLNLSQLRNLAKNENDRVLEAVYVGLLNTICAMQEKLFPSIEEIVDEKVKVLEAKRKYRG